MKFVNMDIDVNIASGKVASLMLLSLLLGTPQ